MPYTYLITHIPSGKRYYGVRWANGCSPNELLKTYFTSSREVSRLIKESPEDFKSEIRRVFNDKNTAIRWESKVLKRLKAKDSDAWFNKTDNRAISYDMHPMTGRRHSEETKKKISSKKKGRSLSDETRKKMSEYRSKHHWNKGNTWSEEVKEKNRNSNKSRRQEIFAKAKPKYKIQSPIGEIYEVKFLGSFAKEHGFSGSNLSVHGSTKGWILLEKY